VLEVEAIVAENYLLEIGLTSRKFCAVGQKVQFLHIVYTLSIFPLGNIKTLWGDASKFVTIFSAFIVDGTSVICLLIY